MSLADHIGAAKKDRFVMHDVPGLIDRTTNICEEREKEAEERREMKKMKSVKSEETKIFSFFFKLPW